MSIKPPKHKTQVSHPIIHATHRQSDPLISSGVVVRDSLIRLPNRLMAKIEVMAKLKNMSIENFVISALYPSGETT